MAVPMRILGIHGLGDHRNEPWAANWQATLQESISGIDRFELEFVAFGYDEIFEQVQVTAWESLQAFFQLAGSGIVSGMGGRFGRRSLPDRGVVESVNHWLKWYAGYVVAWLKNEPFRTEVRKRFLQEVDKVKPHVILAHSLGSLISYDALSSSRASELRAALGPVTYVTLGSQIGNPFVVGNLTPGRIEPLPVKMWYHLYNPEDDVFTAEIRLPGVANFRQVHTQFDDPDWADHAATSYLGHAETVANVWEPLGRELLAVANNDARTRAAAESFLAAPATLARKPRMRAVLVGINDYPDPAARLAGCVNDVFRVSAALQDRGMPAEQMRVVLNERATAAALRQRLHWLLDDAAAGDFLVFFYSGHGAQLPTYGDGDTVDRMDETLVPWDFDWSPERSVTDDLIFQLYSQLPYDTRLVMIFDCCHAGGIHRAGGPKPKALQPPDDIRHRVLQWHKETQMWLPRKLKPINAQFAPDPELNKAYFGESGSLSRLGRAAALRVWTAAAYDTAKKAAKGRGFGPFLPVILEACAERELAYEYRHGTESYGAFTFALTDILSRTPKLTYHDLVKKAAARLKQLDYDQHPALLGPKSVLKAVIPAVGNP